MPATASSRHLPSEVLSRLASADLEVKLKALRVVKNQIIGNRTKKLSFLKLGVVTVVADILAESSRGFVACNKNEGVNNILIQSAAVIGSFACGFDDGVRAVLDAGAFSNLLLLLSHPNEKVIDAGARSLRIIYQSKLAPKYDLIQPKSIEFLISLLDSKNENVSGLGATIIAHSCETNLEQKVLSGAGVLEKLGTLLEGSLSQRDASLESMSTIFKNNSEIISKFLGPENERPLSSIIELANDRCSRTRLLACTCLIVIRNSSHCLLQDIGIKRKLMYILLELLDDPGQVGDDTAFVLSKLMEQKEDLQKLAYEADAIDKLYQQLQKESLRTKRFEGLLLALADMCSKLESCRSRFIELQVLDYVINALTHDSADVRAAASICLKSVARSIKMLSAGYFMNEKIVIPLVQLFHDAYPSVQIAALGAISNVVVDFTTNKTTFLKCGGLKQLVQLSKSMDANLRSNSLWALKNLIFLADSKLKEDVLSEMTASSLASLICDPEPFVQEQALAMARNLVDGSIDSIEFVFVEDGLILEAIGRQLQRGSKPGIGIQGMYALVNVSSGTEFHKEAVMRQLLPQEANTSQSFVIKFLQSNDSRLRTAAVWVIVNLTSPSSPGAFGRVLKLHGAGIVSQIKNMVNDPCLDVKLRVRTVLGHSMAFGES